LDKITVLIIDDQAFYRAGICQTLSKQPDLNILESDSSRDLLEIIEETLPDVVLLGSDLGSQNGGLELGRKIARYYPNTKVIILAPNPDDEELFEVIKSAAVACLRRNVGTEELISTIRRVGRGEYPINETVIRRPKVARHVLRQFETVSSNGNGLKDVIAPLTAREAQILNYIARGTKNKGIGDTLGVQEQTIKSHVSAILRKLNANHRAHAVAIAIRNGLISVEEDSGSHTRASLSNNDRLAG